MKNRRFCFTLDLKNDRLLIEEYKKYHQKIWPEIYNSIIESGIIDMEIYLQGNRLFMIMETDQSFSFDKKALSDKQNPTVQQWEELMWKYQRAIPGSKPGQKWILMDRIFSLEEQK